MAFTTAQFKPGDRVVWLRSPGRSILEAWKVERIPGVVVSICRHCLKISARFGESEKLAIVDPENLIGDDADGELFAAGRLGPTHRHRIGQSDRHFPGPLLRTPFELSRWRRYRAWVL